METSSNQKPGEEAGKTRSGLLSGKLFFDNAIYQVYNYAVKPAAFHETAAPGAPSH